MDEPIITPEEVEEVKAVDPKLGKLVGILGNPLDKAGLEAGCQMVRNDFEEMKKRVLARYGITVEQWNSRK